VRSPLPTITRRRRPARSHQDNIERNTAAHTTKEERYPSSLGRGEDARPGGGSRGRSKFVPEEFANEEPGDASPAPQWKVDRATG
jgi:hypothetical protein